MVRRLLTLLFALSLALPGSAQADEASLLVEPAWLHARLQDPTLRIVDMTTGPGTYQAGHIPRAVYLSIRDLMPQAPPAGFRALNAEEAARLFGRLGITNESQVVIYDEAGSLHASRLFFTLELFGHKKVSILNGGLPAWRRGSFPLVPEIPKVTPTAYRVTQEPERLVTAEWILARLKDPRMALVDARSAEEYRGVEVLARRGGHIPGAVHIEWLQHLQRDGTLRPISLLSSFKVACRVTFSISSMSMKD